MEIGIHMVLNDDYSCTVSMQVIANFRETYFLQKPSLSYEWRAVANLKGVVWNSSMVLCYLYTNVPQGKIGPQKDKKPLDSEGVVPLVKVAFWFPH